MEGRLGKAGGAFGVAVGVDARPGSDRGPAKTDADLHNQPIT